MVLIKKLSDRGFTASVGPDGKLMVSPASKLTAPQRGWIMANKDAIVAELRGQTDPDGYPLCEWLWWTGQVHTRPEVNNDGLPGTHPVGCWWWRWVGETEWKAILDRIPKKELPPDVRARIETLLDAPC